MQASLYIRKCLLSLVFLFCLNLNAFAQQCNIEITITSVVNRWGDKVFLQLTDGSGQAVLSAAAVGTSSFTRVFNYNGVNPPYNLKIEIADDYYQDNAVDYSVKVGGVQDISGRISTPKISDISYPKSVNAPLNNSFAGCAIGVPSTTPCPSGQDFAFRTQQDLDNFKNAFGSCANIVLGDVYIGSFGAQNSNITDLSALYNVSRITGKLQIVNNSSLRDINGLINLLQIEGNLLEIRSNPLLSYCNNAAICAYLSKSVANFPRTITGNAGSCATVQLANANCATACPTGDFVFTTQQEIDNFGGMYGKCSNISLANVTIGASNGATAIKDLRPLQKIKTITGNLLIQNNTNLATLAGLEKLTAVNGYIAVQNNVALTDILALKNVDLSTINVSSSGIVIQNNVNLTACDLPNFCTYLSVVSNPRNINGNKTVCIDDQAFVGKCQVLPVNLVSFTAKLQNSGVVLQWQTSSEINNKGFEIYRSGDDKENEKIGETQANALNTNYTFYDKTPLIGSNYYKLLQIDNDGKRTELGIERVNFNFRAMSLQVYPNPTAGKVNLSFEANRYQRLTVLDVNGKVLQRIELLPVENHYVLNLEKYLTGVYLIKAEGKDIQIHKIVKQ